MSGSKHVVHVAERRIAGLVLASFVLAASSAAAQTLPLGSAESFGVLAQSAVTSTGASAVVGDVGVSLAGAVTGFPPGTVSEGSDIREGDAVTEQALLDARYAFRAIGARSCAAANDLTGQNLGGMMLAPGLYCFDGNAPLTGTLTLTGAGPWTFQVGGLLTIDPSAQVVAPGIATACKGSAVNWQVAGAGVRVGADASVIGNVLARNDISLGTGAALDGRAIALDGGVTLANNQVTACSAGGRFPPHTAIKVTGGGQLWVPMPDSEDDRRTGRGRATFGFVALPGASGSEARGRINYLNHANRRHGSGPMHVTGRVTNIDVVAVDAEGAPKTVRFDGTCDRRPDCTFSVLVEDHGEGRRNGEDDDDDDDDGEIDDDDDDARRRRGPGEAGPHRPRDRFGIVIVANGRVVEARALRSIARGNIQFHESSGPALTTDVNNVEFGPGDSLAVTVSLAPGSIATPADAYVVLELPDGQLMSWTGGGLVPGLVPIARGIVPFPFEGTLAQLEIPRGAPAGRYTWLSALTAAGTLNLLTPIAESVFTITP